MIFSSFEDWLSATHDNLLSDPCKRRGFLSFARAFSRVNEEDGPFSQETAETAAFLSEALNGDELMELARELRLVSDQEESPDDPILPEADFTFCERQMLCQLQALFPPVVYHHVKILTCKAKNFILARDDYEMLTAANHRALHQLAELPELHNPVYVEFDEHGGLMIA